MPRLLGESVFIKDPGIQVSRYPGIRVSGIQLADVKISRYPDINYQIPEMREDKKHVKTNILQQVKNKLHRIARFEAVTQYAPPKT